MSDSPPLAITAAAAKPNESVTHVIHHHVYETAEDNKDLLAIDLTGPVWGTVSRDQQGHVTHASGLNMLMGYSWKTYLRPKEKWSPYYTVGTVSVVVPHFEVGVDWRKNMCVSCFYRGLRDPQCAGIFPSGSCGGVALKSLSALANLSTTLCSLSCNGICSNAGKPSEPRVDLLIGGGLSYGVMPKFHIGYYF